jgi:putative acetyltransferase
LTSRRPESTLRIAVDDLSGADIVALLAEHVTDMYATSPPESVHALDVAALRAPEITFWSVYDASQLVGCGALKELTLTHGELKSMRTAHAHRGRGVAAAMLEHIVGEAIARGYRQLSLETGSQPYFAPARALYAKYGFAECGPFGTYREDPSSVFMTRSL